MNLRLLAWTFVIVLGASWVALSLPDPIGAAFTLAVAVTLWIYVNERVGK